MMASFFSKKCTIIFLGILALATSACPAKKNSAPKLLMSPDDRFQIEVPAAWDTEEELNDVAEIQAAHRPSEMYVAIIRDKKADLYEMTLPKFADITQKSLLEDKKDIKISDPVNLTINTYPALQYEIRAAHDYTRVVYLQTLVETPRHFYQILTWTLPSRWEKNQKTLYEIPRRFKENSAMPETTPALPQGVQSGVV